jgi:hypothetical protein
MYVPRAFKGKRLRGYRYRWGIQILEEVPIASYVSMEGYIDSDIVWLEILNVP